jgi:hypothetical protein
VDPRQKKPHGRHERSRERHRAPHMDFQIKAHTF